MELKKELGKNIKKYRKLNNMTQEVLAEKIGVEVISISFMETGKYFPAPNNLVKLSEALNVSLSDLFSFYDEKDCNDYIEEINKNLNLICSNKEKLLSVNSFIKTIL